MLVAVCQQLLLKMLFSNTVSPRHKDSPSCTKESLASSTRGQRSVQLNKSWLRRWPVIQGYQGVVSHPVGSFQGRPQHWCEVFACQPAKFKCSWHSTVIGFRHYQNIWSEYIRLKIEIHRNPWLVQQSTTLNTSRLIIYKLMLYRTYLQNLRNVQVSTSVTTCLRTKVTK